MTTRLVDHTKRPRIREEYLRRLRDLVLEQGIDGLTTDRISTYLKCSKATLYTLWPHKDQLISEVVEGFLRDIEEESTLRADAVPDPAAKVSEYLTARTAGMATIAARWRDGGTRNADVRRAYATARETSSRRLTGYLRQGIEHGSFRGVDPRFVESVTAFLADRIQSGELPRRAGISTARANRELSTLIVSALTNQE
jgi:AcrR family transcriptional regulator